MTFRFQRIRERLKSSMWFIPALCVVGAIIASRALVALDHDIAQERRAWYLYSGAAESARVLLSTIATAMMSFIGLVFSITILVLQLASAQFSPRVLRTFMRDRMTQSAMGVFVGTFVFAMVLLPETTSEFGGESMFVPSLGVFVAFLLILVSVGVFIRYIHHMANAVRAITVIKRVGEETRSSIRRMYPDEGDDAVRPEWSPPESAVDILYEGAAGVVAEVDDSQLMECAREASCTIEILPMPGEFVPREAVLARRWGGGDEVDKRVRDAVRIAPERTASDDPAFGFRQLVDIAVRALSPGVNDPSTAVQVLDEVQDLIRTLSRRKFPSPERRDRDGRVRLVLHRPDWSAYVRLAFQEIRHDGASTVQVPRRMEAVLEDCIAYAPEPRRAALREELRALREKMASRSPAAGVQPA